MEENNSPNDPQEKISKFFLNFIQNIQVAVQASFKYTTDSIGASIAFSFAFFNAMTTITGAGIILPLKIGYFIGGLVSGAYFIVLSYTKIKAQHPLRRLLLILIFAPFSAYTSFYSIYSEMSEGRLQEQEFKEIAKSHNHLVTEINGYLTEVQSKANELVGGKKISVERINKQIDRLTEERNNVKRDRDKKIDQIQNKKNDLERNRGTKIDQIQNKTKNQKDDPIWRSIDYESEEIGQKDKEITALKKKSEPLTDSLENDPAYKIYIQTEQIKKDFEKPLSSLKAKELYEAKESGENILEQDQKLYAKIKNSISGLDLEKITDKKFEDLGLEEHLNEDNYVLVPIFLVPLNSISSGSKEAKFIWIALIVAIGMEVIPILLSGIHVAEEESKSKNNIETNENSKPTNDEKKEQKKTNLENNTGTDGKAKTVISQISDVVSSLIFDIKELRSNIGKACIEIVSVSEFFNSRNHISRRLNKAMEASQLTNLENKQKFLQYFYNKIDHDLKSINLQTDRTDQKQEPQSEKSETKDQNSEEENNFDLASKLFVDIMDKQAEWLVREPTWEYEDNHNYGNLNSKNQHNKTEHYSTYTPPTKSNQSSFNNGNQPRIIKKAKNNNHVFVAGKWYFTERKYQEFLDWWLESHNPPKASPKPRENHESNLEIGANSNSSTNSNESNNDQN